MSFHMNVERMQENVNRCMKQDRRWNINNIDAYACTKKQTINSSTHSLLCSNSISTFSNLNIYSLSIPLFWAFKWHQSSYFPGFLLCGWMSSQRKSCIQSLNICKFPCCLCFEQIEFKFSSMINILFPIFLQQSMLLQKTVMCCTQFHFNHKFQLL